MTGFSAFLFPPGRLKNNCWQATSRASSSASFTLSRRVSSDHTLDASMSHDGCCTPKRLGEHPEKRAESLPFVETPCHGMRTSRSFCSPPSTGPEHTLSPTVSVAGEPVEEASPHQPHGASRSTVSVEEVALLQKAWEEKTSQLRQV
jgi:hypothetical protein